MTKGMTKGRWVAIIVAAAVTLAASGGIVLAQDPQPPATPQSGGPAWCHGVGAAGSLDRVTLNRVAQLLKTTPQDITTQLQQKTLLEIAQAKGVTETSLIDTLIAPYKDRLQVQVKYGYLTQTEVDQLLEAARQQAKSGVSQKTDPSAPYGYGSGGMMGGLGGMMSGSGGMMGGYGDNGYGGMMGGLGNMMGGLGGMMGGSGGMMSGSGGMMGGWGSN